MYHGKRLLLSCLCVSLLPATASACIFGSERWSVGCEASCVASRDGSTCPKSCIARPGEGEVIINHRVEVLGQSNGSHHVSRVSGDHAGRYRERIEAAFTRLASQLAQGSPQAAARLSAEREDSLRRVDSGEGRDWLKLTVDASPGGTVYAPRRGVSRVRLEVKLLCVAPPDFESQIAARIADPAGP